MKLTKRIIALTISVLMLATLLPAGAFASNVGIQSNGGDVDVAHVCSPSAKWDFEEYKAGTKMSAAVFNDALGSGVKWGNDGANAMVSNWKTMVDPVDPNNIVLEPQLSRDSYKVNGINFASNGVMEGCVIDFSYDIYMTARAKATNDIPFLRFFYGSGTDNYDFATLNTGNAVTPGTATSDTSMGFIQIGSTVTETELKALTWYNIRMVLDTTTGAFEFFLNGVSVGEVTRAAIVGKEIKYFISMRCHDSGHALSAYVDDISLSVTRPASENVSTAEQVNTHADFEELTVGQTVDATAFAQIEGIADVFGASILKDRSYLVSGDDTNKYLSKSGSAPFVLQPPSYMVEDPFVVSFDLYQGSMPSNNGLFSLDANAGGNGGDKSEGRVISFWPSDAEKESGKEVSLYLGQQCSTYPMPLGQIPIGDWTQFDIAVYPGYVDGVLTYYNYAIYLNGDLKLWSELSASKGAESDLYFDVHCIKNDAWTTVTYKQKYDSQKSPFMAWNNTLGSLYFFHFNKTKTYLDNIAVRPVSVAPFASFGDDLLSFDFSDGCFADGLCENCVASQTLLTLLETEGTTKSGKYMVDANGKSGMTFGVNDSSYNFLDSGVIEMNTKITLSSLEGTIDIAKLNCYPSGGEASSISLVKIVNGVLYVGGTAVPDLTFATGTAYDFSIAVNKKEGTIAGTVGEAILKGSFTPVTASKAGLVELGTQDWYKTLAFIRPTVAETLTLLATEDASFTADSVFLTRISAPEASGLDLDFEDGKADGLELKGATVENGVLTLGSAIWYDSLRQMNAWLGDDGFTINLKIKTDATSTTLVSLANTRGEKTALLMVDADGKLYIPASKIDASYTDGSLDVLSADSYVDIAIAITAPAAPAEYDVASIFVDGKYVGNVACDTKGDKNLSALILNGAMSVDSLVVREGMIRTYSEETDVLFELDTDNYVWSGNNRGNGACYGTDSDDGVFSNSGSYVAATETESAYFVTGTTASNYSDIFITGGVVGQMTVIETEYMHIPATDESAATGTIEILRLRFAKDEKSEYTASLYVDGATGHVSTKSGGLCDWDGNPICLAANKWTKIIAVVDGSNDEVHYFFDDVIVYSGSDADENGVYQTRNAKYSVSIPSSTDEVRVRMTMVSQETGVANQIAFGDVKVYRVNNGVEFIGLQESGSSSGTLRFIAGVDTLYYGGVGFELSRWNNNAGWTATKTLYSTSVYTSLVADSETVTAESLGTEYFVMAVVQGIDTNGSIRVRPFHAVGGVKFYGAPVVYDMFYESGELKLMKGTTQDFQDGIVTTGGEGYPVIPGTFETLTSSPIDYRRGGDANLGASLAKDPAGDPSNRVAKFTMRAAPATETTYKDFSGRVKLNHVIPADLTPYIGKTMTVSMRIYVSEMKKIEKNEETAVQSLVNVDSATFSFGVMSDEKNEMKVTPEIHTFSTTGAEGSYAVGQWVLLTHSIEITEDFIGKLAKTTDYTEENGYRYPLRATINCGDSGGYISEFYVDDVSVVFETTPAAVTE